MKQSGIYKIQSICKPERVYIGSSMDIINRERLHFKNLELNKHHSPKLQFHYNKYGKDDLQFIILLECTKEELLIKEQSYMDLLHPYFNICIKAGSHLGMKRTPGAIKKSADARSGEKHWLYGKSLPEEIKLKISQKLKGRPSPFKGHILSDLAKQKKRDKLLGHKISMETKRKISLKNKGKKRSELFCEQCKERERIKRFNKNNAA